MPELLSRDRLQPSLLDRLTDHHPLERQETVDARVLSRQQLRAAVLRDLAFLFNATRLEPEAASTRKAELALWKQYPDACSSVVNFGMPAFAGSTKSSLDFRVMETAIHKAITTFEPRIDAKTLEVSMHIESKKHFNCLQITIRGHMWAQPVPLDLLLAADVDLESGTTRMRDLRK